MTNERAIEILNPEHREHYDSIETVNEACRIGMNAIKELAELKEKIKNKTLIELPCKVETLRVGDTVYYIQEYFNEATLKHEWQVKRTVITYIAKDYIEVSNGIYLSVNHFWLIPEEAKRRLAKLTGGSQ